MFLRVNLGSSHFSEVLNVRPPKHVCEVHDVFIYFIIGPFSFLSHLIIAVYERPHLRTGCTYTALITPRRFKRITAAAPPPQYPLNVFINLRPSPIKTTMRFHSAVGGLRPEFWRTKKRRNRCGWGERESSERGGKQCQTAAAVKRLGGKLHRA